MNERDDRLGVGGGGVTRSGLLTLMKDRCPENGCIGYKESEGEAPPTHKKAEEP